MNLDDRLREILPPHLYEAPPLYVAPRAPETHLEPDQGKILGVRRRADCAQLHECELVWFREHGTKQARCPATCAAFDLAPRRTS